MDRCVVCTVELPPVSQWSLPACQKCTEAVEQPLPTYLMRTNMLKSEMCDHCAGYGFQNDAEPGDTYYNEWRCPQCKGTGLKAECFGTTVGDDRAIK
jgi:DnaJ-class molecular chaperone